MRYAQIRKMDVSNGEGVGISLFVQGCHFHCKNCFNSEAWDFNGGKEWTNETLDSFIKLAARPYIKRISILGGEPFADENYETVYNIIKTMKECFPEKSIWVYTGYIYEDIQRESMMNFSDFKKVYKNDLFSYIDVLVDGQFEDSLKDLQLKFRGSSNQRLINVQDSIKNKFDDVVLYDLQ